MDARLIALKLSLDELNVEFDIDSKEKRIIIQKAVYLGQVAGTDIGYRYIWDQKGPYSGDLARDYHSLADDISVGDTEFEGKELQDQRRKNLESIKPLMRPPTDLSIPQSSWLELIASLHYLKHVVGLSEADAKTRIQNDKAELFGFIDNATEHLHRYPSLGY